MEFYWEKKLSGWEFRIKDSAALLMKMKEVHGTWHCTCLSEKTEFKHQTIIGAQRSAELWLTRVITNLLGDLERYNVSRVRS